MEPIFEADFDPSSYGFRPKRRAQDAIAEIHNYATTPRDYEWVFEGDIAACFDEIDHRALMDRIRLRISDKKVLKLIKAFLKAGILTKDNQHRNKYTGTPQGGILSPLLANIALSVLDEHFQMKWEQYGTKWQRRKLRQLGYPLMKLVRYADDFVVMVHGKREDAQALWTEIAQVLSKIGLRLSPQKTQLTHIDQGFDFLGWHIQRHYKKGHQGGKQYIYTYPSKKAINAIIGKVKDITRREYHCLSDLLKRINPVLQGWGMYYRYGVSKQVFDYVDDYAYKRIINWIRKHHPKLGIHKLIRKFIPGWKIVEDKTEFYRLKQLPIKRYHYRGTKIPTRWKTINV